MIAITMLILWGFIKIGATVASGYIASEVASDEAVHVYYRHITSLLREGTVTVGLVSAVICVIAFMWDVVGSRGQRSD
jgi:hypothetical protein